MTRKLNAHITLRGYLLLLLFLAAFWLLWKNTNRRKNLTMKNDIYKKVYSYLIENGVPVRMSQILVAQAAHETSNFTSRIFIENHNLFGMKLAKIRKTAAIGQRYGHAIFRNIEDSILDIIIYLTFSDIPKNFTDSDSYVEAIKDKGYFTASLREYQKGTEYFLNLYFGG